MKRLWFWMRDVVWTAVVAVALAVSAVVLAVLGYSDIALAVGMAGITFSFLSVRS